MSGLLNKKDYTELYRADFISRGKVREVLNRNGAANMTVCPLCHCDDFTHVQGCKMLKVTNDI